MAGREQVWVQSMTYTAVRQHRATWPYRTRQRAGSGSITSTAEQVTNCGRGLLSRADYTGDGSATYSFYGTWLYADDADTLGMPRCRVCFR